LQAVRTLRLYFGATTRMGDPALTRITSSDSLVGSRMNNSGSVNDVFGRYT
jgi:hypothetical protein